MSDKQNVSFNLKCDIVKHKKKLIEYLCLNSGCKSKSQCCSQCFKNNHKNHQNDCHQISLVNNFLTNSGMIHKNNEKTKQITRSKSDRKQKKIQTKQSQQLQQQSEETVIKENILDNLKDLNEFGIMMRKNKEFQNLFEVFLNQIHEQQNHILQNKEDLEDQYLQHSNLDNSMNLQENISTPNHQPNESVQKGDNHFYQDSVEQYFQLNKSIEQKEFDYFYQ